MIDRVRFKASLRAPGKMQRIGGKNPILATYEDEIKVTPEVFESMCRGGLNVFGINFDATYSAKENTITTSETRGYLPYENKEKKMLEMAKQGWVFDRKACEYYNLPFPST